MEHIELALHSMMMKPVVLISTTTGTVTGPSGFSFQLNVTTNTVDIPGLQCFTIYNINVTAVNCAGVSNVTAASFTTPQPGKCRTFICITILLYLLLCNTFLYWLNNYTNIILSFTCCMLAISCILSCVAVSQSSPASP